MMTWIVTHFEIVFVILLTLIVAVVILQQRRSPQSTAAWLLFVIMLPYVAVPLFIGFGFRKQNKRFAPVAFSRPGVPASSIHPLEQTFEAFGMPPALPAQQLVLLTTPQDAYSGLMQLIAGAAKDIEALFYIVGDDAVGHAFVEALTERARAGVRVRLLMDRLGTLRGPHKALDGLREAGGEVVFFSPFLQLPGNGHLNLRNHRKMVIADHARAFAGGMNIGAHYLHPDKADDRWTDLAYLIEGQLVTDYHDIFRSDWEVATGTALDAAVMETPDKAGTATIQLIPSGPDIIEDPLHDGLVRALHMARTRIWIATPYFVPTEALGNALRIAARRGVDVRIMLPLRSNQRMADFARGAYLREMQSAGVTLQLHRGGMLHAKAMVIDDIAAVGSANFDVRSMLLNFEMMLFAYDAGSVAALSDWFAEQFAKTDSDLEPAGLPRRLAEGVFRLGAPIL